MELKHVSVCGYESNIIPEHHFKGTLIDASQMLDDLSEYSSFVSYQYKITFSVYTALGPLVRSFSFKSSENILLSLKEYIHKYMDVRISNNGLMMEESKTES
jgi:hypothetical protein